MLHRAMQFHPYQVGDIFITNNNVSSSEWIEDQVSNALPSNKTVH